MNTSLAKSYTHALTFCSAAVDFTQACFLRKHICLHYQSIVLVISLKALSFLDLKDQFTIAAFVMVTFKVFSFKYLIKVTLAQNSLGQLARSRCPF